jgi:hypothetical protein
VALDRLDQVGPGEAALSAGMAHMSATMRSMPHSQFSSGMV